MQHQLSPALSAAIRAARAAGRLQRRSYQTAVEVELKPDDTPVTSADRASEAVIRRILQRATPHIDFVSEESHQPPSGPLVQGARWLVDPLDGTKKFVRGLPFFGPSIALEHNGALVLGVIHLSLFRQTLWAERGRGAFLDGRPIQVSSQSALDRAYVSYDNESAFYQRGWAVALRALAQGVYHHPGFLDVYTYAALASGRIDAVVMVGEHPWDIAAAKVIVEEAGGRLTDFAGQDTVYGGSTIASNGRLHQQLLELLRDCR